MKKLISVITIFVMLVGVASFAIAAPSTTPVNPFLDDAMFYCQNEKLKDAEECIKEQIMAAVYLGRCVTEVIQPKEDGPLKDLYLELMERCLMENTINGMTNYVKAAECFDECMDILLEKVLEEAEKQKQKGV